MFRGRIVLEHCLSQVLQQGDRVNQTIWWSQTGSNRRPHACKARALPAELWPRNQKTNASLGPPNQDNIRCRGRLGQRTPIKWWAWEDLNFRPHAYQARALTN